MLNVGFKTFNTPEYKYDTLGDTANVGVIQGIKTSARQAFSLNPSESIFNIFERNEAYNESKVVLKKEDLNKKYAELGLFFENDTREGVVNYLVERKKTERERSSIISRAKGGFFNKSLYLGASIAASFADPVNIAAAFVPVVREARFASMVGRMGATRARLTKGFIEGTIGNAAIEPLVYGVAKRDQQDYTASDAFLNIAAGGILGGTAHVTFGKIADGLRRIQNKPNIYQKLAVAHPKHHEQLLRHSVARLLDNKKIDTGEVIMKSRMNAAWADEIDNLKKGIRDKIEKARARGNNQEVLNGMKELDQVRESETTQTRQAIQENQSTNPIEEPNSTANDNVLADTKLELRKPIQRTIQSVEAEAEAQVNRINDLTAQINRTGLANDIADSLDEIKKIDKNIKEKGKLRQAIKAGTNCLIRNS